MGPLAILVYLMGFRALGHTGLHIRRVSPVAQSPNYRHPRLLPWPPILEYHPHSLLRDPSPMPRAFASFRWRLLPIQNGLKRLHSQCSSCSL
ncbi:hypothetical protein C8R46DRAFT_302219 [Mycena filopes]|nr:hypothetical protein C8R46DRAFT_302219 [Mycena filopes]